jgi:hypothetical protein
MYVSVNTGPETGASSHKGTNETFFKLIFLNQLSSAVVMLNYKVLKL